MEVIRDCMGRIACKGNATTGDVEVRYKGHRTQTCLSIGEVFTVEREGIITTITRVGTTAFQVESHAQAV